MTTRFGSRPDDLAVRYDWCEGSMPPPHYYEYAIHIGPGSKGAVTFVPGYGMQDPPTWRVDFTIASADLDALYDLMAENDLFRAEWTRIEDPPVGGSLEWMEVVAGGERFKVPSKIVESDAVDRVYAAVKALVPDDVWADLRARHEKYVQDFEGE